MCCTPYIPFTYFAFSSNKHDQISFFLFVSSHINFEINLLYRHFCTISSVLHEIRTGQDRLCGIGIFCRQRVSQTEWHQRHRQTACRLFARFDQRSSVTRYLFMTAMLCVYDKIKNLNEHLHTHIVHNTCADCREKNRSSKSLKVNEDNVERSSLRFVEIEIPLELESR